jgi:SWI/SNF-related matrix-associated actin-dependent regulator 1 of chromatin subfamily A
MPKLVICPESLRLNWYKEIKNVTPDADVQIQMSNEDPHFGKDWTIIGYASVTKFLDKLKQFNCIFVDECHACKSVNNWGKPTSKRAASVLTLAENAEYCYLLSGTPLPSHNIDLYNILKMLKCESFDFNSKWAFLNYANKFCDPKDTYFGKDFSGNSNSDQLHALLSNLMVRRLKKDVLPNLKKQRQFIPLDPKFKREYLSIEKRLYKPLEGDTYMGLAMTGRKLLSQYKLDAAIDLAESLIESGESVVLVTNFIESADLLRDHFKDICCEIRGGMTDKAKQQSIDDFQSKKKTVCILNMQAGGVGITLTAAHTMIIIDYAWLPAEMIQVEDRICRTGQTESCMIYYIYCINSILDSLFIEMITNKSANIDTVVDNVDNTFDLQSEKDSNYTFIEVLKDKIKNTTPKKATKAKKKG